MELWWEVGENGGKRIKKERRDAGIYIVARPLCHMFPLDYVTSDDKLLALGLLVTQEKAPAH